MLLDAHIKDSTQRATTAAFAWEPQCLQAPSRVSGGGETPPECDLVDESLLQNRYFLCVCKEFFNTAANICL